jgi:hypothetical protein
MRFKLQSSDFSSGGPIPTEYISLLLDIRSYSLPAVVCADYIAATYIHRNRPVDRDNEVPPCQIPPRLPQPFLSPEVRDPIRSWSRNFIDKSPSHPKNLHTDISVILH